MRVIQVAKDNVIELSWMWLPTFIGQNYQVLKNLESAWKDRFPSGVAITQSSLDEMNEFTIEWLCDQFPIKGLDKYLRAIENVEESGDAL